jgi:hypothetical protein
VSAHQVSGLDISFEISYANPTTWMHKKAIFLANAINLLLNKIRYGPSI